MSFLFSPLFGNVCPYVFKGIQIAKHTTEFMQGREVFPWVLESNANNRVSKNDEDQEHDIIYNRCQSVKSNQGDR